MRIHRKVSLLGAALALCLATVARADDCTDVRSKGQTVYVPIYSEIWHGNKSPSGKAESELMSVLVSIRNTDPVHPIRVVAAPYYNTDGKMIRDYLTVPRTVQPRGTLELFVENRETEGGSGANFEIRWEAGSAVNPPIVEALHSRFQSGRTLGFVSRGKAI